jgi:hypothetical protein
LKWNRFWNRSPYTDPKIPPSFGFNLFTVSQCLSKFLFLPPDSFRLNDEPKNEDEETGERSDDEDEDKEESSQITLIE